jgi:hypothetical protein
MTDIEQKARDMVLEVLRESELPREPTPITREYWKALCRAIEQHEAFKQEVSDAVEAYLNPNNRIYSRTLHKFIIPKPDPLVEVVKGVTWYDYEITAKEIRAALDAAGFEIREKGR